jgi:tetratricopeptide (TPR) repeat protein
MVEPRTFWPIALLTFAVALALRVVHLLQIRDASFFGVLMGDARAYDAWAQRIASGEWIGRDVFYQAPLYPYFLGVLFRLFGHHLFVVRVCQGVIGAAACSLLGIATARLFGRRAGLVSGLILAVYPPAIFFDALIQKTTLDGFFLCALVLAIVLVGERRTAGRAALAGACLGFLALTRENALGLVPLVLAWVWLRDRSALKPVGTFLVGVTLALSPVAIRNFMVDGALHLTTSQLGPNLYIGNNPTANGTYVPLRADHSMPEYERQDAIDLAEQAAGRRLTAGEVSAYWQHRAFEWMVGHPRAWLALLGKKVMLAWNVVEPADTEDIYAYSAESWPLRSQTVLNFGLLAPLGLFGIWSTRDRWRELWIFYAMGAVYTATIALFYVFARYRYPLVPFLAMFAGPALAGLAAWWRRSSARETLSAGAVTAGAIVLCYWPLRSPAEMTSAAHYNIGYALQAEHRRDDAIVEYLAAITALPENAAAQSNLGALLTERGEHREALAHLREAVRYDPRLAAARTNLGIELATEGEPATAIESFQQALTLDSTDVRAHYNLAVTLASSGDLPQAIQHLREAIRLQPAHADAQNNLGVLLSMSGNVQEALVHFAAASAADPSNAEINANLERAREIVRTTSAKAPSIKKQ